MFLAVFIGWLYIVIKIEQQCLRVDFNAFGGVVVAWLGTWFSSVLGGLVFWVLGFRFRPPPRVLIWLFLELVGWVSLPTYATHKLTPFSPHKKSRVFHPTDNKNKE